jgi:ABC-type multidrug transport system fused ATPase/permease subunit
LAPAAAPAEAPEAGEVVTIYGDRDRGDPGAYSVIDSKTIEDVGANHPAEILNKVPGVNVQMNSGQDLLVAIRSPVLPAGAGQGSFLILENGIPTRASGFGNVNGLFEVHHETADAIEVVRGPGSVRYGSNAVHGLLNFIDPEPGAQGGQTLTLSGNTLQRYRADATANIDLDGVSNWIGLSVMDDGGWRDSSGVDQQKLTIRSKFRGETWNAVATLAAVNLNQETAGFIQGVDAYKNSDIATINPNPEAYRDAWAARANVRFETNIGQDKLVITPGERIGILGPVGSGKSTLLRMLSGMYEPQQGRVLLDDLNIRQIDRQTVSEQVGYVQQDTRLFEGTLRDNLLIGSLDPGDDAIFSALKRTGLITLVAGHPRGLELPITEGGRGLSGGQRQLVAFTRLLLTRPNIYLLDEPTASMDDDLERRCLGVLQQELTPGKTLVVVTHKMTLLPLVNRLIVVVGNKVVMDSDRESIVKRLSQPPSTTQPAVVRGADSLSKA